MTLNEKLDEIIDSDEWQSVYIYVNIEALKTSNDDKVFIPLIGGYAENIQNHISDYILNHSEVYKTSKLEVYKHLIYIDLYIDEAKEA